MKPTDGSSERRIIETIVSTIDEAGRTRLAPLGVRYEGEFVVLAPYAPSGTLDNLRRHGTAVVNLCDDVRVYAGCLTGHHDWPLVNADQVQPQRLRDAPAHTEVRVDHESDADAERPAFYCRIVHTAEHGGFHGFNRAQAAVIEGAILLSRVHILPADQIIVQLEMLQSIVRKTAGANEWQAWQWLLSGFAQATDGKIS